MARLFWNIAQASDIPRIPDFEILNRIGGGAYGEVYLARSVTGKYRAVKVVRREDFEYERTFEREFEGIQRYEGVSHSHPGLVDILHVGRDREAGFYYYVMELADDESGEEVDLASGKYKPRTLSSDLRRGKARTVRECVDLGMTIAGALGHLHHVGLIHRDVKPSNIIFVKGVPKLADVGLVASTGQRTYVGTEGYVPPEGPGTSAADLYSLAMVLYEMHTGKDRLDFPELPTNLEIPPSVNRDEWRSLNTVICRAGSPDPRKRYESAFAFAKALREITPVSWKAPEPRRGGVGAFFGFVAVMGLLLLIGGGGYWLWRDHQNFSQKHGPLVADSGPTTGNPKGKSGINGSGLSTPIDPKPQPPQDPEKEEPKRVESGTKEGPVPPPETSPEPPVKVAETKPEDPDKPAKEKAKEPEPAKGKEAEPKPEPIPATVVKEEPEPMKTPLVANPVKGRVKVTSQPAAASVFHDGKLLGVTETKLLDFEPGPVELVLKREGYRDTVLRGEVKEGTQVLSAILLPDLGPQAGMPWVNSLGMNLVPTADGHHQSATEITVDLFDRFLEESGETTPRAALNGIVQITEDRSLWKFSDWLTEHDRAGGYLGSDIYYRPVRSDLAGRKNAFSVVLDDRFGTVILNTEPSGAKVYQEGRYLGETPTVVDHLRYGDFELELYKPGHAAEVAMGSISGVDPLPLVVALERDASVVFGEPWSNSQGTKLVPLGALLVAATETTSGAYLEYLADQGVVLDAAALSSPRNYPAAGVSYGEARAFCQWLTKRERAQGLIRPWQRYRLPTDLEWSRFAGLPPESGDTPEARNGDPGQFVWGREWPPPAGAGNFADLSATGFLGGSVIKGYTDGFETTAPVGSFGALPNGLFDLAGNLWEWVEDPYSDGSDGLQVVRGGGWNSAEREVLSAAYRNPVPATASDGYYGFRYVLEDSGSEE